MTTSCSHVLLPYTSSQYATHNASTIRHLLPSPPTIYQYIRTNYMYVHLRHSLPRPSITHPISSPLPIPTH